MDIYYMGGINSPIENKIISVEDFRKKQFRPYWIYTQLIIKTFWYE